MSNKTIFAVLLVCFVVVLLNQSQVEARSRFLKKLDKRSDADLLNDFERFKLIKKLMVILDQIDIGDLESANVDEEVLFKPKSDNTNFFHRLPSNLDAKQRK